MRIQVRAEVKWQGPFVSRNENSTRLFGTQQNEWIRRLQRNFGCVSDARRVDEIKLARVVALNRLPEVSTQILIQEVTQRHCS